MNLSKELIRIFLFLIFVSFIPLNGQAKLTPEQIKAKRDSLLQYKKQLKGYIKSIKSDIDTLRKQRDYLDEKVKIEFEKLYILKYGKDDGMKISQGRIWKGMTEEMLKDSWGSPDKTNTDQFSYGTYTQHEYGDITFFFENRILIDWEDKGKKKND